MILLLIAVVWMVVATAAALFVAGGIRLADRRAPLADHLAGLPTELTVADIIGRNVTQPQH